ncbi:MAG TPA: nuclear transport factor 2 family protein [Terriglobales bacterium]
MTRLLFGIARCLALVALLSASSLFAADCLKHAKTPDALVDLEHTWAKSLDAHDAQTLSCILADEFEDYSANGAVYGKSVVLDHLPQRKPGHNELSDLHPHVNGDMGYVRGLNTVTNPDGTVRAKVRFTDIFNYRDGRWLAVAGQESLVQDAPK